MSWTTGTQTEALAANTAVGSAQNTFTSARAVGPASGAGYLPANFFLPSNGAGKALLVKAYGVLSTTGTPTLALGVSLNTTQGTYNSGGVLAVTAATTMGSSVTNVPWELEVLATCVSTGASGTFLAYGFWKMYPTSSTITSVVCASSTANPNTAVSISTESAYYAEISAAWGTSSASNTLTVYQTTVIGLN